MEILGLTSEEHARRLSRQGKIPGRVPLVKEHLFFRETVDEWISEGQFNPKQPTNPLQEEAKSKCDLEEHDWLFDEKFDGIAYSSEDAAKQPPGPGTSFAAIFGQNRTCYFCGYSTFVGHVVL